MNKLTIVCDKIEDRIKEQKLAEKRGWIRGCYGMDKNGYYVEYFMKRKIKAKKSNKIPFRGSKKLQNKRK